MTLIATISFVFSSTLRGGFHGLATSHAREESDQRTLVTARAFPDLGAQGELESGVATTHTTHKPPGRPHRFSGARRGRRMARARSHPFQTSPNEPLPIFWIRL
jgi:hypothetical protein